MPPRGAPEEAQEVQCRSVRDQYILVEDWKGAVMETSENIFILTVI